MRNAFQTNLLDQATLTADSAQEGYGIEHVRQENYDTFFKTTDGINHCVIEAAWDAPQSIRHIVMKENVPSCQGQTVWRHLRWRFAMVVLGKLSTKALSLVTRRSSL